MKRLYYILSMAVLLISGCQKQPLNDKDQTPGGRLQLNPSLDGIPIVQTRAAREDTDLKTYGFYLAGYHTEGVIATTAATAFPNVFDREIADQQLAVPLVKYENNKFTLKTIKWALDDVTYLSFFGWGQNKPYATTVDATTTGIIGQTYDIGDKGYPWLEIRNADAPADQTDVVASRSINHKNDAVVSAVDLDFRHLLTKLSFKAKSSSSANITFTEVNVKYAADKVCKKARYTFGSDPTVIGAYTLHKTEFQTGTHPVNTTYPSIIAGAEVVLGSALLLPQELQEGDISFEIKYKISPNSSTLPGLEQTKTLPLSAFTFEQGNHYVYTVDIQALDITVLGQPTIEPWDIVSAPLPLITGGPMGDVLLLLDGYDKPYKHTDGKWYWLDRSGYNRHVELVGFSESQYDGVNHCYTFNNTLDNYGLIPPFPQVTALTADVVAQKTPGATSTRHTLLDFHQTTNLAQDDDRRFWTHMGNLNSRDVFFDCSSEDYMTPGKGRLSYSLSSNSAFETKTMWSFLKKDGSTQSIYQNASLKAQSSTSGSKTLGVLSTNILGRSYGGSVSYLKVTAAERTPLGIVTDYQAQAKRFNITESTTTKYLPPVIDGLVFCFDGRSGIKTVNGTKYWEDQVGKNDAQIIGNVPYANNHFTVNTTDFMKMIYNVPVSNNFTVEIVLKPHGRGDGSPIFWATSTSGSGNRMVSIHLPYTDGSVWVDAPGGADRYSKSWPSGFGGETDMRQVAIRRTYTASKSEFFMYGRVALDSPKTNLDISNTVCTIMDIGGHGWGGDIYAVRYYNRALTNEELTANYTFDKTTFGFTD